MEYKLRKLKKTDAKDIAEALNNKKILKNLVPIPYPYKEKHALEYITRCQKESAEKKNGKTYLLGIEVNKKIIGLVGFHNITKGHKASFGYWLAEPYWGNGIMSKAVKEALKDFQKKFKLKRIEAGVFSWNKASMRVLEKNGFKLEGIHKKSIKKGNKYIDEHMYAKIK